MLHLLEMDLHLIWVNLLQRWGQRLLRDTMHGITITPVPYYFITVFHLPILDSGQLINLMIWLLWWGRVWTVGTMWWVRRRVKATAPILCCHLWLIQC